MIPVYTDIQQDMEMNYHAVELCWRKKSLLIVVKTAWNGKINDTIPKNKREVERQ